MLRHLSALVLIGFTISSHADTTFTYQGELTENGQPANGAYNMDFSLWDAAVAGNQIGSTVSLNGVQVTEGGFAVDLDFGADAFDNSNRWLEVAVNAVTLAPRHAITRTPYAIQTRGMFIGDDGNVIFDSMNAVEGTVTMTSIGGIDLIIDADTNNVGEDQNARIVMKQDGGQVVGRIGYREGNNELEIMQEYIDNLILGTNNQDKVWIRPDGFVGIGRPDKVTAFEEFGIYSDALSTFAGMYIETAGQDAAPFYGYAAGGDVDAYHYLDGRTGNWHFVNPGGIRMTVGTDGHVGIGTVAPTKPLHVVSNESAAIFANSGSGFFNSAAVWAQHTGTNGSIAVYGNATGGSGDTHGGRFDSHSTSGRAVLAWATADSGSTYGVWGEADSSRGTGVLGLSDYFGVRGQSNGSGGRGVFGICSANSGIGVGVWGESGSPAGFDFYAAGAGFDYGSSSSIRWKRNIEVIDDPLSKVAGLRGVYFDWDEAHGGGRDVGMNCRGGRRGPARDRAIRRERRGRHRPRLQPASRRSLSKR